LDETTTEAITAIGVVMLLSEQDEPTRPPPPAAAVTSPPAPQDPPPAPQPELAEEAAPPVTADETIAITLVGVPDGAQVFLDDVLVEGTVLRASRSSAMHAVRIVFEGHRPWRRSVVFQQDASLTVSLEPGPEPSSDGNPARAKEPPTLRVKRATPLEERRRRRRDRAPFDGRFDGRSRPRFGSSFGD